MAADSYLPAKIFCLVIMRFYAMLLLCLACLMGQDFAAQWKQLVEQGRGAGVLRKMAALAPGNARLMLSLAAALGPGEESTQLRKRVAVAGIVFDSKDEPGVRELVLANKAPISNRGKQLELPGTDWIAEDLVKSARGYLVSSVRKALIFREDGTIFAKAKYGVFGLALDPKRGLLWSAQGWSPYCQECAPGGKGKGALIAYDLNTGKLRQRIDSIELGDVTVGRSGDVYVTSNSGGALFVLTDGSTKLERLDTPGEFPSPQQPALSQDGKTLYVADYRRGIVAIDVKSHRASWLKPDPSVIVNGIDGLYLNAKTFVAVQNGVNPVRIIALDSNLRSQRVLEANWPGLGEATHGVVERGEFCFLANTGWDAFDDKGKKKSGLGEVVTSIYCRPLP